MARIDVSPEAELPPATRLALEPSPEEPLGFLYRPIPS
jgi:hypothetical protein